jgi:hypothetical protein
MRFEKHNDMLFRVLDKPTPLTPDTEMPCLVRLIQDDSPMGLHNKDMFGYDPERLTPRICTEVIDVNDLSDHNRGSVRYDGYISCQYYHFEIIGTPVAEGSEDWAWYQMMKGAKVKYAEMTSQRYYAIKEGCDYCALYENDGTEVPINTRRNYDEFIEYSKWLGRLSWQIYEEPEPQYKVGDWVEIDFKGKLSHRQVVSVHDNGIRVKFVGVTPLISFDGKNNIVSLRLVRKLSPSEVVIRIGCLSGTVKDLSYEEDGRFWLIGEKTERCPGGMHAILYGEMLDTETSELVEGLLKAQKEEEQDEKIQ